VAKDRKNAGNGSALNDSSYYFDNQIFDTISVIIIFALNKTKFMKYVD